MGEKPTSAGAVNPGGGKHMSDNQDTQVSESDAELEREIRKERKFTLAEAIGRLAGPGAMKGESPVTRLQQAEAQIESWLRSHLADAGGALRVVLYRHVKGSELLLNNFDQPLVVLARLREGGLCTQPRRPLYGRVRPHGFVRTPQATGCGRGIGPVVFGSRPSATDTEGQMDIPTHWLHGR